MLNITVSHRDVAAALALSTTATFHLLDSTEHAWTPDSTRSTLRTVNGPATLLYSLRDSGVALAITPLDRDAVAALHPDCPRCGGSGVVAGTWEPAVNATNSEDCSECSGRGVVAPADRQAYLDSLHAAALDDDAEHAARRVVRDLAPSDDPWAWPVSATAVAPF